MTSLKLAFVGIALACGVAFAQQQIVPDIGIGPLKLGMPCEQIKNTKVDFNVSELHCDEQGNATSIATNTGGSVAYGWMMVGTVHANQVITEVGQDFSFDFDAEYEQSRVYWLNYNKLGIGFRVLYIDKHDIQVESQKTILQSIRVFKVVK